MDQRVPKISKPGLAAFLQGRNEKSDFLEAFYFRTLSLFGEMDAGNIGKEVVALESLLSAFSILGEGETHEEVCGAYPVQSWREDTMTVPTAWLRVLAEGWHRYKEAPDGKTFGEVMNLEGGGQGQQPLKSKIKKLNRETALSNRVLAYWIAGNAEGAMSQNKAISAVAEEKGVSTDTVKNAWNKRKSQKIQRLIELGVLEDPKG